MDTRKLNKSCRAVQEDTEGQWPHSWDSQRVVNWDIGGQGRGELEGAKVLKIDQADGVMSDQKDQGQGG